MFELPKLAYSYDALEPHLDSRTMEIHHTKHHQAYTDKLNSALVAHPELSEKRIEEILRDLGAIPEDIRIAVQNNGGGYYNHNLFWQVMSPAGGGEPKGSLLEAINQSFGSFANFKEKFSDASVKQFGSGWAWLCVRDSTLEITSTSNQDCPLSQSALPILCLDVWEHAYYLKYQNKRADYIASWWNVVNWEHAEGLYESNKS